MKLRIGEVLVKKRGGASKRVRVGSLSALQGIGYALLSSDAVSNSRGANARQWWVTLGDDGLPEGYKRATS